MALSREAWVGIGAAAVAGVLVWTAYQADPGDVSWTDPQQPPPMLALPTGPVGARKPRPGPRWRDYPGSLSEWSDCVVGDC